MIMCPQIAIDDRCLRIAAHPARAAHHRAVGHGAEAPYVGCAERGHQRFDVRHPDFHSFDLVRGELEIDTRSRQPKRIALVEREGHPIIRIGQHFNGRTDRQLA